MDFKAQIIKDLAVFHNPREFAEIINIWYCGCQYTIPAIMDHAAAMEREIRRGRQDHAEGINQLEALLYISHEDLGFVPQKGMSIEIEEAGAINLYEIMKSSYEDGEIILELGAYIE